MDPSKRDTLIQWINAISSLERIESLQELRDGEQFICLLTTITSKTYTDLHTKKERFEAVQKFIEDYYSYDFNGQVNFDRDNELDIAKMLILVLSAGVQGEQQEQFMNPALSLDQRSQVEIMNILKEIVSDSPNKLNLDNLLTCRSEDTFDSIDVSCLFSPEKSQEEKSCPASVPSKAEFNDRSTSTSSLIEIMSPFQRINVGFSPAPTTPLHSLITSTGFSSRIIQRERNLRRKAENEIEVKENFIKKLTSELNMERHMRSDVEMEMQEKIRTINSKDDKIRDLMTQNRNLKQLQDKLDELNTLKEEYEQMAAEAEKSKNYLEELKDLRLQNSSFKKEMNELYDELNTLKEMKTQFKILQLDCNKYVEELQKEEKKYSLLQSSLDLKQKALDDAINSKHFTEDNLGKMKEMYEDVKKQYEELLTFQSVNEPSGERMTVITDQLMDELKKELDELKSTWINPSSQEEMKIKLANIINERDSFESKSLKLCEDVLQVQSDNDMLKKKNEDFEIELEKCQRHLQESQRNMEKLTANLEAFDTKETQWHQSEMKYKTDLQQLQTKMGQMQMELSCVSTELKLSNAQLESDFKCNEMRRQTLVQSVGELRNEKKLLEQTYEADQAAVEEKAKNLKSQLETLKMEFASKEQELLAQNESVAMERRELEQQLETERRLRDNMEKNLTSQREEVENELNETICQLKEDLKASEEETLRLRSQLREKIDEYDGQVESLTNVKFELQTKVNKLESQANLDKQERLKLQAEVKKSGERAEDFEQNIVKLSEKLNKATTEKKDCQEKLQDVEKKLEVAIEESQHWISKNSSDKKMFESQITTLEQERAEFAESNRSALEKLSEELRSSLDQNCELKSQLQKETDLLTDNRAELDEKQQLVETMQEQLSQLQKLHSDLQEQNSLLNNNLVMTQSQLACKESEVTDLERKLGELSAEKICLVESHEKELGDTRQALSQEIVNLNEQIKHSKSALLGFVEQVGKVTNTEFSADDINPSFDIGKLVESVGKEIYQTVEDRSQKLSAAEEKCALQDTRLSEIEENLQVNLQEAETLKEDLRGSRVQCEQLQATMEKQQQQLEENDNLIKNLEEKKSSLDSQIVSERESYQERLDNIITECNTTEDSLKEKTACIAELTEQSTMLDNELKSVRQDMCQLETTHQELQQSKKEIEEKLTEKILQLESVAEKTSQMTLTLTEKDSLIESQSEIQSQLEESLDSLKQKLSANDMEINLLKSDLEQKDFLIKEKNTELSDFSATLEQNQRQMMELTEEHMTAIADLQQEAILDYERKLDAIVADYENNICENYVSKLSVESLELKHNAAIEEERESNEQEHEKVISELREEHEANMNDLKNEFETRLSAEFAEREDAQEQNLKHVLEVEQLQDNIKEYRTKMESLEQEHKDSLESVVLEYKEKIATDFIPNSVFDEHKERHQAEITQIQNELSIENEKKIQHLVEEHQNSVKQLTCSYEEKLTTDYVPRQVVEEEKEKLVLETRTGLEVELQEKMAALQQEHEAFVAQKEQQHQEMLTENYAEKSVLIESEAKHEKEIQHMVEEHQNSVKQLTCSYEEKLITDYVPRQVVEEEKEKLVLETRTGLEVELQEKMAALQQEHEAFVAQKEQQHQEMLTENYAEKSVLIESEAKHEKEIQHMVEEHQNSVKQLTCSYEEKLTTDYVPRQAVEEEKEKLVLETRTGLEVELQEKLSALQQEHEAIVSQKEQQHQEMLTENYVEKSALIQSATKLTEKEKELLQQRAEFDLIVAASENVKDQHEESVKAYELRMSELVEKLESQEMHISRLEEQVVNEKFDGERQASEIKRTLEGQLTEMKMKVDTAHERYKVENDQLKAQVGHLESCKLEEMTQMTEKYQRDFEQMKQNYQMKVVELETTYKTEIDQLKESHLQEMSTSQAKYEEIHQNLVNTQSKVEEAVSLKEQEMKEILANTEKQLKTENSVIEEKLTELKSEFSKLKDEHKLVLKSNEEKIVSQNCCINQLKDECRINQRQCDKVERQLREREQKLIMGNMKTLTKAEEMNKSLSDQLFVAQKEVTISQKKMDIAQKDVESLNNDLKLVKQMKQKAVNELQEYKIHCLELKENFSMEKSKLEKKIRELKEQQMECTADIENMSKLVKHYKNREESKLSKLVEQNEEDKKALEKLTNKIFALEQEKKSLADYLKQEEERFKAYDKEKRTLQRKVSDLTEQLEKAGNALFDSNNYEIDLPNDSLDSPDIKEITKRTYELRSKTGVWNKMKVDDYNISPMSYQSRESISSYKSVTSNTSNTSKTSIPPGCGQFFSCEDEPTTFDWGRITEIRRRNTMVPAHLRSTYPAELQNIPTTINEEIAKAGAPGSGKRKRKSPATASKTQQMKEVKDRPGTPGRLRRLRVRSNLNNENSPQSEKKRLCTKTTPRQQKFEKMDYTGRPSMAFDISNTPKLSKRRQKGRSTIFQMPEPKREPLKTRNCHQTNL